MSPLVPLTRGAAIYELAMRQLRIRVFEMTLDSHRPYNGFQTRIDRLRNELNFVGNLIRQSVFSTPRSGRVTFQEQRESGRPASRMPLATPMHLPFVDMRRSFQPLSTVAPPS